MHEREKTSETVCIQSSEQTIVKSTIIRDRERRGRKHVDYPVCGDSNQKQSCSYLLHRWKSFFSSSAIFVSGDRPARKYHEPCDASRVSRDELSNKKTAHLTENY